MMFVDTDKAIICVLAVMALFLAGSHLLCWKTAILDRRLARILGGGVILATAAVGWGLTDAVYPF